jgi:glycosyltransferase involved in cell wall biosynthesis
MGGSEFQINCLMQSQLLNNSFEIYLLCKRFHVEYKPDGYNLVSIVKPHGLQQYAHFIDAPFLINKLKKIAPDVIYQNIGTSYAGISTYFAKNTGSKMVLHIASDNNIIPFKGKKRFKSIIPYIEKKTFDYAIRHADKIIAQTNNQKKLIQRHYYRTVDEIIYNFHPLPSDEPNNKQMPVKVVWIANFKQLKQPEMFIRLANDISKKSPANEFVMIGKPSYNVQWQNLLENQIKHIPNLTYIGGKTNKEINQILAKSHILVNTSLYEGFSNTFIQAWMRCVPVVSLNSNPDGFLDGEKMGFVSNSYEQLCKDVSLMVENHRLREKMGREAQEFALRKFSMENAKKVINLLES